MKSDQGESSGIDALTPAERGVLSRLLRGTTSAAIAAELGRSVNTVNHHTRAIFAKVGVKTRAALVARCATAGILAEQTIAGIPAAAVVEVAAAERDGCRVTITFTSATAAVLALDHIVARRRGAIP